MESAFAREQKACSAVEGLCVLLGEDVETDTAVLTATPSLQLNGDEQVSVALGRLESSYDFCIPKGTPGNDDQQPCDRGVTATNTLVLANGTQTSTDITDQVSFSCSFVSSIEGEAAIRSGQFSFSDANLGACGVDTVSEYPDGPGPGKWIISFQVTNSRGVTATTVQREVQVTSLCEPGEALCESGTCVSDAILCTLSSAEEEKEEQPFITLQSIPGEGGALASVPKGQPYLACWQTLDDADATGPCEPGAVAGTASSPNSLTSQVLACPPEDCTDGCEDHLFVRKGVAGCIVDPTLEDAEVGDTFSIPFVLILATGERLSTARDVYVSNPCEREGDSLCDDLCVPMDCDTWEALGSPSLEQLEEVPKFTFDFGEALGDSFDFSSRRRLLQHTMHEAPASSSSSSSSSSSISSIRKAGRGLLQDDGSSENEGSIIGTIRELRWAYNYPVESTGGIAWPSPYITPCQPGLDEECGVGANDALAQNVSVYSTLPCIDAVHSDLSWAEWSEAVTSVVRELTATGQEAEEEEQCATPVCSPRQAQRGQCLPGRYAISYKAIDSRRRLSNALLLLRVQAAAAYSLVLQFAVNCEETADTVQQQLTANTRGAYLEAAGVRIVNVQQAALSHDVNVTGIRVHPGTDEGGTDSMPPLCLAEAAIDLQVGCTPEDAEFNSKPRFDAKNETLSEWCPCDIDFNPSFMGNPISSVIDSSAAYSLDKGIFGPLLSIKLQNPRGSDPQGPSPYCHALTNASDSETAQAQESAGLLSQFEDESNSLLARLDEIIFKIVDTLDIFNSTANVYEDQFRSLLNDHSSYLSNTTTLLFDFEALLAQVLSGLESISTAQIRFSSAVQVGQLLELMPNTSSSVTNRFPRQGLPDLEDVYGGGADGTAIADPECVEGDRGGANTKFLFVTGSNNPQGTLLDGLPGFPATLTVEAETADPGDPFSGKHRKLLQVALMDGTSPQDEDEEEVSLRDTQDKEDFGLTRIVGVRSNVVLTGGFLLQGRHPPADMVPNGARYERICHPGGLALALAAECGATRVAAALSGSSGRAIEKGSAPRLGVDPAFNAVSFLFDSEVANHPEDYYNTSDTAGEVNPFGIPYGYQAKAVHGLSDQYEGNTYPVVLDINLFSKQARRLFDYLREGAFFDPFSTAEFSFKLATFSADLQLFGYATMHAKWDEAGLIRMHILTTTLEHRDYTMEGLKSPHMPGRLANDIVLLLFVLLYALSSAWDIADSYKAKRRRKRLWKELLVLKGMKCQDAMERMYTLKQRKDGIEGGPTGDEPTSKDALTLRNERLHRVFDNPVFSGTCGCDEQPSSPDVSDLSDEDGLQEQLEQLWKGFHDEDVNEHPVPMGNLRLVRVHRQRRLGGAMRLHAEEQIRLGKHLEHLGKETSSHGRFYKHARNSHPSYRSSMSRWWIIFEVITVLFLWAGMGLLLWYSFGLQPEEAPVERRHHIYDTAYFPPAHPLMLKRGVPTDSENDSTSDDATEFTVLRERDPGEPGRWRVGVEDETGLRKTEVMFRSLNYMYNIKTAYTLILAGALVLLTARLIALFSFQPRLSLMGGTLVRGASDFLYYIFVIITGALMLAMMMSIVFGTNFEPLSSPPNAILLVAQGIASSGMLDTVLEMDLTAHLANIVKELDISGRDPIMNAASRGLAYVLILIRPLLFLFLFIIVMSIFAWPYTLLKDGARSSPSVKDDIIAMFSWLWKEYVKGQPGNADLAQLAKHLCRGVKGVEVVHGQLPHVHIMARAHLSGSSGSDDSRDHTPQIRSSETAESPTGPPPLTLPRPASTQRPSLGMDTAASPRDSNNPTPRPTAPPRLLNTNSRSMKHAQLDHALLLAKAQHAKQPRHSDSGLLGPGWQAARRLQLSGKLQLSGRHQLSDRLQLSGKLSPALSRAHLEPGAEDTTPSGTVCLDPPTSPATGDHGSEGLSLTPQCAAADSAEAAGTSSQSAPQAGVALHASMRGGMGRASSVPVEGLGIEIREASEEEGEQAEEIREQQMGGGAGSLATDSAAKKRPSKSLEAVLTAVQLMVKGGQRSAPSTRRHTATNPSQPTSPLGTTAEDPITDSSTLNPDAPTINSPTNEHAHGDPTTDSPTTNQSSRSNEHAPGEEALRTGAPSGDAAPSKDAAPSGDAACRPVLLISVQGDKGKEGRGEGAEQCERESEVGDGEQDREHISSQPADASVHASSQPADASVHTINQPADASVHTINQPADASVHTSDGRASSPQLKGSGSGKGRSSKPEKKPEDDAVVVAATRQRVMAVLAAQRMEDRALEEQRLREIRSLFGAHGWAVSLRRSSLPPHLQHQLEQLMEHQRVQAQALKQQQKRQLQGVLAEEGVHTKQLAHRHASSSDTADGEEGAGRNAATKNHSMGHSVGGPCRGSSGPSVCESDVSVHLLTPPSSEQLGSAESSRHFGSGGNAGPLGLVHGSAAGSGRAAAPIVCGRAALLGPCESVSAASVFRLVQLTQECVRAVEETQVASRICQESIISLMRSKPGSNRGSMGDSVSS